MSSVGGRVHSNGWGVSNLLPNLIMAALSIDMSGGAVKLGRSRLRTSCHNREKKRKSQ